MTRIPKLPKSARSYRRVETISNVVTEDHVLVTDETVMRTGLPTMSAATYSVQWFNGENGQELPEASAIYNFLESEFVKLSINDED